MATYVKKLCQYNRINMYADEPSIELSNK
jgi:hypothetical protein